MIAIVEDNLDNQLLLEALLEDEHETQAYMTGPEALAGFEAQAPSLVLMDISLPGMDGVEVLRRMKEDPRFREIPVIALTAHAMSGDRERFLAAGFDDYLTKPIVDDEALLTMILAQLKARTPR